MASNSLIRRAADLLVEAPDQHDPETEKALDYLEQQGVLTPENRNRVRQTMMQALQQSGGDIRAAIQTVQASNKRMVTGIEREHGQQLAHPQIAPLWQKARQYYEGVDTENNIRQFQQSLGAFKSYASTHPLPKPSFGDKARDMAWRISRKLRPKNPPTENPSVSSGEV